MRNPSIINANVIKAYNSGILQTWDQNIPQTLRELCILTIATNWQEHPILDELVLTVDRGLLLELLPINLPLSLTIPRINDDIYWKRSYMSKWPQELPRKVTFELISNEISKIQHSRRTSGLSNEEGSRRNIEKHWKQCFLEMYVRDYLETLKASEYQAEEFKELSDLCENYVRIVNIRQLQCDHNTGRIPLNSILAGFKNLTELSLCFKQIYVGEQFTWDVLQVSLQDANLLARGLEKCKQLQTFKLINSNIDDFKLAIILRSLLKHDDLKLLDFSHCQIKNHGCIALANFLTVSPVKQLNLNNNRIGSEGIEALCYALCKQDCNLQEISLKLNPLTETGANLLIKALSQGAKTLKKVSLNGCGVGVKNSTLGPMIEHNTYLECLDLCNNPAMGEELGQTILQGLKYNTHLTKLDVRMCNFNTGTEFEILKKTNKNRTFSRRIRKPIIVEPHTEYEISAELRKEIEEVFANKIN